MIDVQKLEKVRKLSGGKIIARCPACYEVGNDSTGNHLVVWGNGAFSCVQNPGKAGGAHRRRIFELVGDKKRDGRMVVYKAQDEIKL